MTSTQQRAALQRQIWQIANDVRGSVDGWDFKQYVLGTLFYRFISENFTSYVEADDDSIHYANLSDRVITDDIKDDAIKTKGYFIYPSQLFATITASANNNESKPVLIKFMTMPVVRVRCYCKPKNTLTRISLKMVFMGRRLTTPLTTWRG